MKDGLPASTEGAEPRYFLETLRIIEAASDSDREKLTTFVTAIVNKFRRDGFLTAARAIERAFNKSRQRQLIPHGLPKGEPSIRIPVDIDSQIPLADIEFPTLDDVAYEVDLTISSQLERFVKFAVHRDALLAASISTPTNLLLYGTPGCGKTMTARYIAARLALPLLTARSDALVSSYLGNTSKNIRALFAAASSQNCILFLDELDAVAKARDDEHELGELKRVVIGLLQNLDSVTNTLIVLAATNHEHLLDSAIWRRFPNRIHFSTASTAFRQTLFGQCLRGQHDSWCEPLARLSAGLTPSQIREIVDRNRGDAIINRSDLDFRTMVSDVLFARDPKGRQVTDARSVIRKAKASSSAYFTQQRLADLFGLSKAQVSAYLRE